MKLIALAGGIGSGKSTVGRILETLGFRVYDCDSRAKLLMDSDADILQKIASEISEEVIENGLINRKLLASIVFADSNKLSALNKIVHSSVIADIHRWADRHAAEPILFVETAILLESGLHLHVDEVWMVDATVATRIQRACARDNASEEAIRARMALQLPVTPEAVEPVPLRIIDNDGALPLLPQLFQLLQPFGITPSYAGQWKS